MWSDVDEEGRVIKIQRTGGYQQDGVGWQVGKPKIKAGCREIPLTKKAKRILQQQKEKVEKIKEIPNEFFNYVFLSSGGKPIPTSNYNKGLCRVCKVAGVRRISVHVLRHTFATMCAEAGMLPKTLQYIMGHASITMTMNIYVHATTSAIAEGILH